jgi:hypothetical protein
VAKVEGYYSNQYQIQVASGANVTLSAFQLESKIALKLGALYTDAYTLKTSTGISTTTKGKCSKRHVDAGVGLRISRNIKSHTSTVIPYISAMYYRNILKNNSGEQQLVFANHKFNSVVDEVKNSCASEFGINFVYNNIEFNTNYSINWKKNFHAKSLAMMLKYKF